MSEQSPHDASRPRHDLGPAARARRRIAQLERENAQLRERLAVLDSARRWRKVMDDKRRPCLRGSKRCFHPECLEAAVEALRQASP
jgi:hypothetical protein